MDLPPLNEWVVTELTKTRDALSDLMERHENILHHLTDVCRRNDRMRQAGDALVTLIHEYPGLGPEFDPLQQQIDTAIQKWGEANV